MKSPGFRPRPLPRISVEAPLQPRWRVLGPEEERRLHARAREDHVRFQPLGPRMRRRLVRYVVGTSVGFAVLGWLFVMGDLRTLWTHALVGAPLGAVVAWWRPGDFVAGGLYATAGFTAAMLRFAGPGTHSLGRLLMGVLVAFLMGTVGILLGRAEADKRLDLSD